MTLLQLSSKPVQRVSKYKLPGVMVNATLKFDDHIAAITSKAAKRLWFLMKLKHARVTREDLIYLFEAVVQPVLDTCPAWHTSLNKQQSHSRTYSVVLFRSSSATFCTKKHGVG